MKILILNWRDITHPWAGGAERHLHELAKQLVKNGHDVTFLCGGYKGALRKDKFDGIQVIRVGNTYSAYVIIPLYYIFRLRRQEFDCVIDTSHGIPFFTPLFTRRPKILIVHHSHKKLWETEFGGIVAKIGVFLENSIIPKLYKRVTVVTLSETEKRLLERMGFKKVFAIPPGIDGQFFNKKGEKAKLPTILYLGRLRKYKRVDLVLNIFPEVKKKVPNVRLIIAGDGQDRARLEHLARAGNINDDVIFKGFVSEKEKLELLQEAWVLAFPSLIEGWGLVAMEAASCGTPTVGFRVPGVIDAVKHEESGLLARNKKDFVTYLVEVLTNRTLRKSLSEGSLNWSSRFKWAGSASKFLALMQEISTHSDTGLKDYGENYFERFWRKGGERKFHPVYDFRVWFISTFLKPRKLLDVGCGTGFVVNRPIDRNIDAHGMDISKYALERISRDRKDKFFVGDIKKIPSSARSFDTVTCIDVLEHIRKEDLPRVIRECARVAKRAIYFDITVLEDILFIFSDSTHVSKFFSWQWHKILKKALGDKWEIKRGPILLLIHHGIFIAQRK